MRCWGERRGPQGTDDSNRSRAVCSGAGKRPKARVLIEASTESEWVARCLEELGHEVIVADPNFAQMYATRSKRVKTDRRDARTLAEACRLGAYRRAHRSSEEQRRVRAELAVREGLVRTRTRYISLVDRCCAAKGSGCAAGRAREDEVVGRLCTAPGVGVVTAVAFRAALDEAVRFRGAHQVECYLGLVPRERSSGEEQH
ncbi:MAG: transposase [Burkholderiales bacterium]